MNYFDLCPKPLGEYSQYNPDVSPELINEVAAGALRFSHSNINKQFPVIAKQPLKSSLLNLRFNYRQGSQVWDGMVCAIKPKHMCY